MESEMSGCGKDHLMSENIEVDGDERKKKSENGVVEDGKEGSRAGNGNGNGNPLNWLTPLAG